MAIQKTNLFLKLRALNPFFDGTPQEFAEAIVAALEIVAPFGVTTFVIGSTQPISNQGPWLKDGTQWWVWDDDEGTYVPLDIDASFPQIYFLQAATPPTTTETVIWFKLTADNKPAGIYFLLPGGWTQIAGVPVNGPTASRPEFPYPFQEFYDTSIEALLWFERGQWRTKSGVKGDLKYVDATTQELALNQNPGWEIFGTGDSDNINHRGKSPAPASKDNNGANALPVPSGITARSAYELYGIEEQVLSNEQLHGLLQHIHATGQKVPGSNNGGRFFQIPGFSVASSDFGGAHLWTTNRLFTQNLGPDNITTADFLTTWPVWTPDDAPVAGPDPVETAPPSIALFLLRKT